MQVPLLIFGLVFAALGAYLCYKLPKQRKTLTEPIDGKVVSYEEGWTTSFSNNNDREEKRERAWFPVVTYSVNGVTHKFTCRNSPEFSEPVNTEGKTIPLLYNPANPGKCVEADSNKANSAWAGLIILLIGIVFIVISFIF
jgi:hypothetical protein